MAEPTQVLQSETVELSDKRTHCSVKVQVLLLQASTDLKGSKWWTMVRRPAAQEHSAALAQLAARISAIMKFGAGADDDPFVKVKEGPDSVSITRNRLRA